MYRSEDKQTTDQSVSVLGMLLYCYIMKQVQKQGNWAVCSQRLSCLLLFAVQPVHPG